MLSGGGESRVPVGVGSPQFGAVNTEKDLYSLRVRRGQFARFHQLKCNDCMHPLCLISLYNTMDILPYFQCFCTVMQIHRFSASLWIYTNIKQHEVTPDSKEY